MSERLGAEATLAAVLVVGLLTGVRAAAGEGRLETDVFVSGKDGYHTFRIPALIVTTRGTLLAFCEGRKTSRSDHGDIDLVLRRSADGGKTWGPLEVVHEEGGTAKITIGNPCPVLDQASGTLWLTLCRNNNDVLVTHSTDDGKTWATPRDITKDVKQAGWTWYATGPGVGIQLERGPHKGRLLIPCDHRIKASGRVTFSHVFYSDDRGRTWRLGGTAAKHTNECQAVQAADGTLLLNMRSYWWQRGKVKEREGLRAVARSADGGETWGALSFDQALIEPVCQASFLRYTLAKAQGRNRLLFANPASKTARHRMTVRLSYDEGRTWPVSRLIHAGSAAYCCLAALPDTRIGLLYERDGYKTIAFTAFTLGWLTNGKDTLKMAEPAPSGSAAASGSAADAPGRSKYLLLDSRIIEKAEGVKLSVGTVAKHAANPLFGEEKPWEPRFDNLYANVLLDEEDGLYKCWYSPFIIDRPTTETPPERKKTVSYMAAARAMRREKGKGPWREMGICYATSKDGLRWDKPLLDVRPFKGQKSSLVAVGPHGTGIFKDRRETDPARRYKAFFKGRHMAVMFSPDGLRWSEPRPCPEMAARGDTHNNAFWAPELGKYVGITRLWDGQRIVGRSESRDFVRWTKAVEVLRGDKANQTYAMPVFRYAGVYLGLVMVFRPKEDRTHCELAWSPDTVAWHRIDRGTPLIPNSAKKGDYDWGCVYAAAYPVFLKDEIRLYYGASNGVHTSWRDGFLALATLRPDGFAGCQPGAPGQVGSVTTKPLPCVGQRLLVSADAKGGALRVAIVGEEARGLAQCEPIRADVTDGEVRWKGAADLSALRGKPVRLRFELRSARLYAFRFAD